VRDGDRIAALRGSGREAPIAPAAGPRGALRVLDALVRWYATPPEHDDGLGVALDHADRLLRPGARLVVLADPLSVVAQPPSRWPTLVQHREVVVLLLCDPLERDPPRTALPFWIDRAAASAPHRVELDLAAGAQRERWQAAFSAPMDEAQSILKRSGIRGFALSTDAPSESWLDLFAGTRAA
jgi:hypothetical protein